MKSKKDLIEFVGFNILKSIKFDKDITQIGIFSLFFSDRLESLLSFIPIPPIEKMDDRSLSPYHSWEVQLLKRYHYSERGKK